jgi:hypothetical protein
MLDGLINLERDVRHWSGLFGLGRVEVFLQTGVGDPTSTRPPNVWMAIRTKGATLR